MKKKLQFLKTSSFVSLEKTMTGRFLGSCAALDETESINLEGIFSHL
jgi:hypothetical protein